MAIVRWTDEMLDKLAEKVDKTADTTDQLSKDVVALSKDVVSLSKDVTELSKNISRLAEDSKELNIRFNAYQQASQWVVNLAFGLLATATITTIVTAVFRK
jgi:FtsZ-binding cell division protein ZapB